MSSIKEQSFLQKLQDEREFSPADILRNRKVSDENNYSRNQDFFEISNEAKGYVENAIELKLKNNAAEDFIEIFYRALIGDPLAVKMIKGIIEEFISLKGLGKAVYPTYYESLVEAVFQHEYGVGPISLWKGMHDSQAAKVIGTDIWCRVKENWVKQKFSFRDTRDVLAVCERFKHLDCKNKLDSVNNTELETVTLDGIRISIMIPGRSFEPVITLRRQTVENYQFEQQSQLGTIPGEAIPLFKYLANMNMNSIIAGPPAVGKSTFLMTMLAESQNMHTAYVESTYEFYPRSIFPGAPIIHVRGKERELEEKVFPALLRHDIQQIVVQEIRSTETEIYGSAGERGIKKLMGTFHIMDPVNIPGTLARLNIQHHNKSGLNYKDEYIRFAENLHFSITMDETIDGLKRITGVQFYDIDPITWEVSIYKIMHYDWEKDSWQFSKEIPGRIKRLCLKRGKEKFLDFKSLLGHLSERFPMDEIERKQTGMQGSKA